MHCYFACSLFLAVAVASSGCAADDSIAEAGSVSVGGKADSAGSPIRLLHAEMINQGCSSCISARVLIDVENLAHDKDVTVVYSDAGGPWTEAEASYLASTPDNREIWMAQPEGWDLQFAVRYEVLGEVFRDDNNGNNYFVKAEAVAGVGIVTTRAALGVDRELSVTDVRVIGNGPEVTDRLQARVLLRNRTYDKDLEMVHSRDGWSSVESASGRFRHGLGDIEQWQVSTLLPRPDIGEVVSFAISLNQAGRESWDNNFGDDFVCVHQLGAGFTYWDCFASAVP